MAPCTTPQLAPFPIQNGVLDFSEFADAMAAWGHDEEMEKGCQEVRHSRPEEEAGLLCLPALLTLLPLPHTHCWWWWVGERVGLLAT